MLFVLLSVFSSSSRSLPSPPSHTRSRAHTKGTARRKKKVIHKSATTDDKKLQATLKKLSVNTIPQVEEVNMIKDDGTVIHFGANVKVQAAVAANTFAISGVAENKQLAELMPGILSQLGSDSLSSLKKIAESLQSSGKSLCVWCWCVLLVFLSFSRLLLYFLPCLAFFPFCFFPSSSSKPANYPTSPFIHTSWRR